jgi:hypothetical protein
MRHVTIDLEGELHLVQNRGWSSFSQLHGGVHIGNVINARLSINSPPVLERKASVSCLQEAAVEHCNII